MIKLLLVEDDPNYSYAVKFGLEEITGGYQVTVAYNGREGLKAWEEVQPDVIIADIDMPVMNGMEMVERIRQTDKTTLILFASGLVSPKDVTDGYALGVHGYVKKPYVPEELAAQLHALMKMREGDKFGPEKYCYKLGCYTFDAKQGKLQNNETGQSKLLTPRAAQILQILAENVNDVVPRDVILGRLWDTEGDYFASRSLDVFISNLRKDLEGESGIEIKTARGVGLMLVVTNS